MFRTEHETAVRHAIRSLAAAQKSLGKMDDHPLAVEMSETFMEQARYLEEVRIEIHNQLRAQGVSLELRPAAVIRGELEELERKARLENGILA